MPKYKRPDPATEAYHARSNGLSQACNRVGSNLPPSLWSAEQLLSVACTATTRIDFLKSKDKVKPELIKNLTEEITALCLARGDTAKKRDQPFARTKKSVEQNWPMAKFRLEDVSPQLLVLVNKAVEAEVIQELEERHYQSQLNSCSFIKAILTLSDETGSREVKEACGDIWAKTDDDIEALPNRQAVLQTMGLLLERAHDSPAFLFTSSPAIVIPHEAGSASGVQLVKDYLRALQNASAHRDIFYQWNYWVTVLLLRSNFEKRPGDKRLEYLEEASRTLTSYLHRPRLHLSYYQAENQPDDLYGDWRNIVSYVDDEYLVLVFRDHQQYRIESGVKIRHEVWKNLADAVRSRIHGQATSPMGESFVEWSNTDSPTYLSMQGELLSGITRVITVDKSRKTVGEQGEIGWKTVYEHVLASAKMPKAKLMVEGYVGKRAEALRRMDRYIEEQVRERDESLTGYYQRLGQAYPLPLMSEHKFQDLTSRIRKYLDLQGVRSFADVMAKDWEESEQ